MVAASAKACESGRIGDIGCAYPSSHAIPTWLSWRLQSQAIVTAGMTVGVLYYHNTQAVYLTCTSLATSFLGS